MIDYTNLGLTAYENYISDKEHIDLVDEIQEELSKSNQSKYMDRNKVLRYGDDSMCANNYQNIYIPTQIDKLCDKLVIDNILPYKPDTININEYLKGDFISPHIDRKISGPIITILSLKSDATMYFTSGKERFEIILKPKSIIQMKNTIRWSWHHAICPVLDTRYSIVFRNKHESIKKDLA